MAVSTTFIERVAERFESLALFRFVALHPLIEQAGQGCWVRERVARFPLPLFRRPEILLSGVSHLLHSYPFEVSIPLRTYAAPDPSANAARCERAPLDFLLDVSANEPQSASHHASLYTCIRDLNSDRPSGSPIALEYIRNPISALFHLEWKGLFQVSE
jgi:hypothetical protein